MDTLSLLAQRQSLRIYNGQEVSVEVREQVLKAAVGAPTAGGLTLYSMIEIDDQELKEKLVVTCDNQPFIAKAPWVVMFVADYQRLYDAWIDEGKQPSRKPGVGDLMLACCDALIAAQTAVVAAEALGLGSCYIGDIIENAEEHQKLLGLPQYVFPITMLCFGYKPEGFKRDMVERIPLEFLCHKNGYTRKVLPKEGRSLQVTKRSLEKFEADFSVEMTRSVGVWLENWK